MPETMPAGDLTAAHVGRRIRVDGQEGVLRNLYRIDDSHVQLLLAVPDAAPVLPTVGQGAPVELLDR